MMKVTIGSPAFGGGRRASVVTCSTRAAAGTYADTTGPMIVERLRTWGFDVPDATVVADGEDVSRALKAALDGGSYLVVTTGGTGISPSDQTPERTRAILDAELPGIAEAMRAYGVASGIPEAMLSRGVSGVAASAVGRAFVVNLPGSRGGVNDGLAVLERVVEHALDQLGGGDH